MSYEQKYKKALKVIGSLYNVVKYQSSSDALLTAQTIEKAFPELRDSEDERIRKSLIRSFTNQHSSNFPTTDGFTREQILYWLEKQGEEKPADKIEPKFNVGDWILIDRPCRIELIDDNGDYVIQYYDSGTKSVFSKKFCETHFHLWTIQDAKDGDVLANKYGAIFINAGSSYGGGTKKGFEIGKNEGIRSIERKRLKDLPKWKKCDDNLPYSHIGGLNERYLIKNGYCIKISDLETLQKEE